MSKISLQKVFFIFLIVLLAGGLTSCTHVYDSSADYFDGTVLVEYHQSTSRNSDDSVTFTFNDTGDYNIKFSYTNGNSQGASPLSGAKLPADFKYTVKTAPRTKVVSQYVLPGFLNISITHDGVTESHDFK